MARFIDLDLDFKPHPVTGDLAKKTDAEAIKRSVKLLVLTQFGERLFQPEIGSSVGGLLFEPFHPITVVSLENSITEVIQNYEPRVELIEVRVDESQDDLSYIVNVKFSILGGNEPVNFDFILERTR